MIQKLQKLINSVENFPLTITQFILAFSAIIVIRMLGENLLMGLQDKSLDLFIGSVLVAFLFFLFSYLIVLIFIVIYTNVPLKKAANILLWGFFIVIFPPILDKIICGQNTCWSFYIFDGLGGLFKRYLTFFGHDPFVGITFGVRIEVALAVIFLTIYFFIKTRKIVKSVMGGLISYTILFILGSFPSWLTFAFLAPSKNISQIQGFDIAGLFLSPVRYFSLESNDILNALNVKMNFIYAFLIAFLLILFFWLNFREKFMVVAKNVRWIQIMIHAGLVLTGMGLGAFYFPHNLNINVFSFFTTSNLVLAAVFAWLASLFLNDQEDIEIDKLTNPQRPTAAEKMSLVEYQQLFWLCFMMSLILALTVGLKFFLLVFAYQVIGWAYSAWPFRLKRFPIVASFLSALALAILFFSGFMLLADNQDIKVLPVKVFWLLLIAFTVSLPIKDLKDIEGDKKNGVWTVPVLGDTWARFLIGLGIFVSYSLSVVWLNAKILFIPAMIAGAASFWILQNKKISPRRVHIWVFGFLFLYVILMAYLVFWPAIKVQP